MAYSTFAKRRSNELRHEPEVDRLIICGEIADKGGLLKDEADEALSQVFGRKADEASDCDSGRLQDIMLFLPGCHTQSPSTRSRE